MQQIVSRIIGAVILAASCATAGWAATKAAINTEDVCKKQDVPAETVHLKGRFSFYAISDDHLPVKAVGAFWNIHVRWTQRGTVLGYCFVETAKDGTWSLQFKRPWDADALEVAAFSQNAYVAVTTQPGDAHEVARFTGIALPATDDVFDTGELIADLSGTGPHRDTHLLGVGDVMSAANAFWNKTWNHSDGSFDVQLKDRNGDQRAIRVYYPNTWHDCGNANGKAATCASPDERAEIWITGPDITDTAHEKLGRHLTVMHELAHVLNADAWKYIHPEDPKTLPSDHSCPKVASAMMEGFATAIAAWVLHGENKTEPWVVWLDGDRTPDWTNLETPEPHKFCARGEGDATWVSALFWDLLDTQDDRLPPTQASGDQWNYPDPLTPFRIYLQLPKTADKKDRWKDVYHLKAALKNGLSQADQQRIDEIYRNSQMLGP